MRIVVASVAFMIAQGCEAPRVSGAPDGDPTASTVAVVELSRSATVMKAGTTVFIDATVYASGAVGASHQVTWASSDPSIVSLTTSSGMRVAMRALRAGTAMITAQSGGVSAASPVVVVPSTPPTVISEGYSPLMAEVFDMVEFQYPDAPGRWFYAPLLTLRNATGGAVSVTSVSFQISDFWSMGTCRAYRPLPMGQSVQLLTDIYGDYQLAFEVPSARAPLYSVATASIGAVDASGVATLLVLRSPVIAGSLPDSYTVSNPETQLDCTRQGSGIRRVLSTTTMTGPDTVAP